MPTCESCGRDDEDTVTVQRIYLLETTDPPGPAGPDDAPGSPGGADGSLTPSAGDIEEWCASCRATFPHVPVDG